MEHRWSPRKPYATDVVIHYRPLGLIRGRTKDISLEGMYVSTGRITLPKNEPVDVCFTLVDGDHKSMHQMGAFVVHSQEDGVGLMFRDFQSSVYAALENVLFEEPPLRMSSSAG